MPDEKKEPEIKFERIVIPNVLGANYRQMYEELRAALFGIRTKPSSGLTDDSGLRTEEVPEPDVIVDTTK
jgi:hypothetical protein